MLDTAAHLSPPSPTDGLAHDAGASAGVEPLLSILWITCEEDSSGLTGAATVHYAIDGACGECVVIEPYRDRDVEVVNISGPRITECDEWLVDAVMEELERKRRPSLDAVNAEIVVAHAEVML